MTIHAPPPPSTKSWIRHCIFFTWIFFWQISSKCITIGLVEFALDNMGGCRGYFRDPWLALNFLREMWLLLFNPRELWFVYYRDPWFHNYFPRYLWKRPHFFRENDEKFWKMSVFLNDLQRKIESEENVKRRWNIFGINAGAPSTQMRRY